MSTNETTPLRAPEVRRMAEIERRIRQAEPELAALRNRLDAAEFRFAATMARYDEDASMEPRPRAEFDAARQEHHAAYRAWSAVAAPVGALRAEWLQLQVVRAFLPRCAICERTVGSGPGTRRASLPAR